MARTSKSTPPPPRKTTPAQPEQQTPAPTSPSSTPAPALAGTPGLWKPEQAAGFLNVSPARLARMRSDGIGPCYIKFGREIRYHPRELHKYVVDHTIVTRSSSDDA